MDLSFAIVSPGGRLQYRRQSNRVNGLGDLGNRSNRSEGRDRQAGIPQETLLTKAVLCRVQYLPGGMHRRVARCHFGCRHRNVFELKSDHIYVASKIGDGIKIFIVGLDLDIGNLPSGRIVVG